MKLEIYIKMTRKSAGSPVSKRLGIGDLMRLRIAQMMKIKLSAKRLQKKFLDWRLMPADLSGMNNLVDIADLC